MLGFEVIFTWSQLLFFFWSLVIMCDFDIHKGDGTVFILGKQMQTTDPENCFQ